MADLGARPCSLLASVMAKLYQVTPQTEALQARTFQVSFLAMKHVLTAAVACFFWGLTPAWATGGFSCTIDDANLKFDAQSPLGRGMGSPIINLQASGVIKLKGTPADLVEADLSKHLVHSWMAYPDLRLHFYREREGDKPHAYVELLISAVTNADEGTAEGTYEITVFTTDSGAATEPLSVKGTVSCTVE